MLTTTHDDTWNVLNMQHIIPNLKRWNYSDIPCGGHKQIKGPAHMAKGGHHLIKPPTPTQTITETVTSIYGGISIRQGTFNLIGVMIMVIDAQYVT